MLLHCSPAQSDQQPTNHKLSARFYRINIRRPYLISKPITLNAAAAIARILTKVKMAKEVLNKRTESGTFKIVIMHQKARAVISLFPKTVRFELGYLIYLLQMEVLLLMPQSRPMRIIALGAYEIRIRAKDGNYRVFYFTKNKSGILVFHAFVKKNRKTPQQEIELGRKRLAELQEKF